MTTVLRGISTAPFVFGSLDDAAPDVAELSFVPMGLTPDPAALDDAFEAGRQSARDEQDERVAALQAELDALRHERDARADADAAHQALCQTTAETLQAAWSDGIRSLEPALATLAIEVAQALLRVPLSESQRAAAEQALMRAIDTIAGGPPVTVSLHPLDMLRLQESGLAAALDETHPGLRWEPDAALDDGDWKVSTAEAAVHRVRTSMVTALYEQLGIEAGL